MKVLHLIGGGDVGGAKTHVLSLVKELSKHIDVKIVSFRGGTFSEDAKAMGINVEIVRSGVLFYDIAKVVKIIRKEGFDVIHSHGAKANIIGVIVKHYTGVAHVTTVHSDYRLDYMHSFMRRITLGYANATALRMIKFHIAVSRNLRELLEKRGFYPEGIFSIQNGIDFGNNPAITRQEFSNKYNLDLASDDIVVGVLARLTPIKGIGLLLDAAKNVLDQNPSIKFLIGGDGEERKALEAKAESLGISKNVYFLGFVDANDFMACIDINVLSSISEGFPYSILEGALQKKATISSDVGGISDLVENGNTGYLFPSGDRKMLSDYILKLSKNKKLRDTLGNNIFEKAKLTFSLTAMCKEQLKIYHSVIKITGFSYKRLRRRASFEHDAIITGYYGFKNIGDDAILKTIIRDLKLIKPDIKLLVLSRTPSETAEIYGIDALKRKNIFHVIIAMKHSYLLLHGGGTLIQDNTSTRSLMYYLGTLWLAKLIGLKVMLFANGIGPIRRRFNRIASRIIINKVDVITLREEVSRQELSNLFIFKPKIVTTADPAMSVEPVSIEKVDKVFAKEHIDSVGPFVGFSVRNWFNGKVFENIIAKTADYMIEKYKVTPVFIPMQYPNDLDVSNRIVSKMKNKAYVIKNKYGITSEDYITGIISKMDMLIGMRLHALIFAASIGVPVVGIVYDTKIESFLNYIKQPQSSAGYINELDFEQVKFVVDETWKNRDKIRKETISIIEEHKTKAFENAKLAVELLEECEGKKHA